VSIIKESDLGSMIEAIHALILRKYSEKSAVSGIVDGVVMCLRLAPGSEGL